MIRAELRWVLKMVEPDFSFNSAENMVKLLCLMDKDGKDLNDMQEQLASQKTPEWPDQLILMM